MPGQSVTEIRNLLAAAGLSPQHRFGQNFLIDLNLMRKLVDTAEVRSDDVILEVGPGTGSLTEMLLATGAHVVAVEIDRGLQRVLSERFSSESRFTLIAGDALETKHALNPEIAVALTRFASTREQTIKLVANLPYQIATPLLLTLLQFTPPILRMTCTIQKEVGQRLRAAAGDELYGPISIIMQIYADVRIVAQLPPSVFWPRPEVESVMVDIAPKPSRPASVPPAEGPPEITAFSSFVQNGFQQRRKMLRRVFADWMPQVAEEIFAAAGVNATQRPEELPPAAWVALHLAMERRRPG